MIAPTLQPPEIAAVLAADRMDRVKYSGGSEVAVCGRHTLFASGSSASFAALWAEAVKLRAEAK
jgi:hypothetical protein